MKPPKYMKQAERDELIWRIGYELQVKRQKAREYPATQKEIAAAAGTSEASVSRSISRLMQKRVASWEPFTSKALKFKPYKQQ